jgi:hypothetical protein
MGKLKLDALLSIAPTFAVAQAEDELMKATDFTKFLRVPPFQPQRITRPLRQHP